MAQRCPFAKSHKFTFAPYTVENETETMMGVQRTMVQESIIFCEHCGMMNTNLNQKEVSLLK